MTRSMGGGLLVAAVVLAGAGIYLVKSNNIPVTDQPTATAAAPAPTLMAAAPMPAPLGAALAAAPARPAAAAAAPAAPAGPATPAVPARRVIAAPEGFETATAPGGVVVYYHKDNESWVKESLAGIKPATRPTTMPGDLADRLVKQRTALIAQMKVDLALASDKPAAALVDEKLTTTMRNWETWQQRYAYMPVTPEKLRELILSGWGKGQFDINRITDQITTQQPFNVPSAGPVDDTVIPVLYEARDLQQARAAKLANAIAMTEQQRLVQTSLRSQLKLLDMLITGIRESATDPLKLRRDQQWFGMGIENYFATKYLGPLTGDKPQDLLALLATPNPNMPVNPLTINLVTPKTEDILKTELVPAYNAAMRLRATAAVAYWAKEKGDASITKVLAAVRANVPADGVALVKLIQSEGGIDLSRALIEQR